MLEEKAHSQEVMRATYQLEYRIAPRPVWKAQLRSAATHPGY